MGELEIFFLLLGNGIGGFGSVTSFTLNGIPQPWDIVASDLNSDGKVDIVVAGITSNNIGIVLGSGTGTFSPAFNYSLTQMPWSIMSADFNGDSKMDIIAGSTNYTTSLIYLQNCSSTGIVDFNNDQTVSIFPNPASNTLNISDNQKTFENSEIEILNYIGQTVLKTKFKKELDVSELSNGVYTLQIKNPQNQIAVKRLVIAK